MLSLWLGFDKRLLRNVKRDGHILEIKSQRFREYSGQVETVFQPFYIVTSYLWDCKGVF